MACKQMPTYSKNLRQNAGCGSCFAGCPKVSNDDTAKKKLEFSFRGSLGFRWLGTQGGRPTMPCEADQQQNSVFDKDWECLCSSSLRSQPSKNNRKPRNQNQWCCGGGWYGSQPLFCCSQQHISPISWETRITCRRSLARSHTGLSAHDSQEETHDTVQVLGVESI